MRFLASVFFSHESAPNGFLIHTLNLGYHTPLNIFLRPEISCYWDFWPPIFFHELTPYGFLIHTLNLGCHTPLNIFLRPKISCYCPFKTSQKQKTPGGKKIYSFLLLHGRKYVENCGNEALKLRTFLKLRTSEKIAIAELRSCGCGSTLL